MNYFFCIVSCAILIATANAKPSTTGSGVDEDPFGYYEDVEDNPVPPDQNDDASLPPRFLIQPEVVIAKQGEGATLRCPAENAENYGLFWRKDQEIIAQGTLSMDTDLYAVLPNNTLLVKNVKPQSTGYYTCVVAISEGNNISLTHKLKLENDALIVSLLAQNNNTQIYAGDTLVLTCEVNGKPMPNIKWYFDSSDQPGVQEVSYGSQQSKGNTDTLTIPNVSFKNKGTYKCIADNKISADHQSIVIEVFGAPTVYIEKVFKGKTLIGFKCLVTASPTANIFWKRNGEIVSSKHILHRTKNSLQLIFNDVEESDLGKYTCTAKNFVSTTEKDVIFRKPLQPQFRGFSPQGQILTWTIFSPDPLELCVVYYKGENETRHSVAASDITKIEQGYLITYKPSVPHDGTYRFSVKCSSETGSSEESQTRSLGITGFLALNSGDSQISAGLRLLPSLLLVAVTAILMNP